MNSSIPRATKNAKAFCIAYLLLVTLSVYASSATTEITSVTDEDQYRQFCSVAASSPEIFSIFRCSNVCRRVIDTVSQKEGQECLAIIKRQSPEFLNIEAFKRSDKVGNPLTYYYDGIGEFSPTTLRYIKVASDLMKFFGSLDDCTIVEIGGGYGGQCKIISDLFKYKQYIIIDLPEPLALTKRFLEAQGVKNVIYLTPNQPIPNQKSDLVISNYAFSELTEPTRKKYIKDVFRFSTRGYLLCNDSTSMPNLGHLFAYKKKLINEINSNSIECDVYAECPLTGPLNYLVVWGHLDNQ